MDISELRDRVYSLSVLENKMADLHRELNRAHDEVSALLRQYERERGDVERLEKESLSSFLLKLTGRYEDKLEQEQREEISAKLIYDRAAARLSLMGSKNLDNSPFKAVYTFDNSVTYTVYVSDDTPRTM